MDQAQGAAGTGEAEQPTQTQTEPEVRGQRSEISPLQAAVRKELNVEGHRPEEEPKSEVGGQRSEEEPKAEPELQPEPEPEQEEAGDTPVATEEPEAEQQVPGDWPQTAKARVAEEARKRRDRTAERDHWQAEAEKLAAQLQQATAVQLRPTKALTEVVDRQSLSAAENHWKEIRRFARTNPDGAYDVLVGQNADGTEKRMDFPKEEIIKMGLDADEAIEALPARRDFVAKVEAEIAQAKTVYPDLWKATEAGREAATIVQRAPWLLQEPDWAFVIGDYLAGRKMRLAKQGKSAGPAAAGALSPGAQALLGAPKVAAAPGVIKSRSASGGPGQSRGTSGERVDSKQADEAFYAAGGTAEALEEKIKRKLAASQGGRAGGKQAALV
jgi:hypothetical protein